MDNQLDFGGNLTHHLDTGIFKAFLGLGDSLLCNLPFLPLILSSMLL